MLLTIGYKNGVSYGVRHLRWTANDASLVARGYTLNYIVEVCSVWISIAFLHSFFASFQSWGNHLDPCPFPNKVMENNWEIHFINDRFPDRQHCSNRPAQKKSAECFCQQTQPSDFSSLHLVGGSEHFLFFHCFPYMGNNHPKWLMCFRGVGQPPTSSSLYYQTKFFNKHHQGHPGILRELDPQPIKNPKKNTVPPTLVVRYLGDLLHNPSNPGMNIPDENHQTTQFINLVWICH